MNRVVKLPIGQSVVPTGRRVKVGLAIFMLGLEHGIRRSIVKNEPVEVEQTTNYDLQVDRSRFYTRGFFDGFNAATKHITFDTNTGKFSVELTNVLSELKP